MRRSLLHTIRPRARHSKSRFGRRSPPRGIHSRRLFVEPLEDRCLLAADPAAIELFNVSPALFVENLGQWSDPAVRYAFQGSGANVLHTQTGPVIQLFQREDAAGGTADSPVLAQTHGQDARATPTEPPVVHRAQFSVSFAGANLVEPVGLDQAETVYNYFVGDRSTWRSGVPTFQKVAYQGLYDGIDLVTWGRRDSLKYEFHVAPGADYRQIQVRYEGISGLALAEDGSLVVNLGDQWGDLVDAAPYIYQDIGGQQAEVPGRFVLLDDQTYSFALAGPYDSAQSLVIDPNIAWSTYLGGSDADTGVGIDTDDAGNVYVTGHTYSTGWISGGYDTSQNGARDAFVAKLTASGGLAWSSYLGGSGDDYGIDVAVDGEASVYVTGWTYSSGWISGGYDTTYNGNGDAYLVKLTASGGYVWGTYMGGGSGEAGYGIAVDGTSAVYVTGSTTSSGWTSGGYDTTFGGYWADGFVVKLSADGAHIWSTYLGGSNLDVGRSVVVDNLGMVYVAGYTESSGWLSGGYDTSYNGGKDPFVAKLTTSGGLAWSTYLGGTADDDGYGIAVDGTGVYVSGSTQSSGWTSGGFDTSYNGSGDAYVAKVTASGGLAWSTYLGGTADDDGYGIAVDGTGVYVSGSTQSSGWTSGGFDTSYNGSGDAYVAKVTASGGFAWSSYLGGSSGDGGFGLAVDGTGGVYVTGYTASSGWTSGGYDTTYNGGQDAFVAKITDHSPPAFSSVSSTFDTGLDGWTLTGSGILSYSSTGGNPGGYAKFTDVSGSGGDGWLIAPGKFLGDWSGLNGTGVLAWDHKILTYGDMDTVLHAQAVISGPGGQATYGQATSGGNLFQPTWTTFSAPIAASSWTVNSGSWDGILTNVSSLRIRIEAVWNNGANLDVCGIDNVRLGAPDTTPPVVTLNGFSTDVNSPTVENTASFIVSGSASDPQSGVVSDAYHYCTFHWNGTAWDNVVDHGASGNTRMLGPFGDGLYAIELSALNGAGLTGWSAFGYFLVDTPPPTADIVDVTPDPRTTALTSITIVFTEPVSGFGLGDLTLTRDGGANLLTAGQTLTTTDNVTWTLGNLSGITGTAGTYVLTLTAAGSGIADAAGNPLVEDATEDWTVNPTSFVGTAGDDAFTFTAGGTWHEVIVTLSGGSPTTYRYPASENPTITFNGLGGNDSVTFNGGSGDETAEVYPDHGTLTGGNYSVSVSNVESITATSGGGNDQVSLHDGPQADTFIGSPTYAILTGPGVLLRANGFRSVIANATAGAQDVARLFDSAGDDTFTAYPTYATLATSGETPDPLTTYSIRTNDFGFVMAYANQGGTDAATFFDSDGNDTFATTPTYGTMSGKWRPEGAPADRSFYNRGEGFDSYEATSTAGADLARLTDSPTSDDQFVGEPAWATLSGSGVSSRANGFRYVVAYATGGTDAARLDDSAGTDTFVSTPGYAVMYASASANNPAYLNRAGGFDRVEALSQSGGDDSARLYDSAGDDLFTAYPTYVLLANDPSNPTSYSNKATGFRYTHASASGGGTDKAWLYDSSGDDTFEAYPTYAVLSNSTGGQAFYTRANYFDQVVATSSGGADIARFFDSALKDVFTFSARAASNDAVMTGSGYLNQALNFRYVLAYATTGGDEASLYDSPGDDKFYGSGMTARLYDAALAAYLVEARSFQKVDVFGSTGTNTRMIVRPIDYALTFSGPWVGDPWP